MKNVLASILILATLSSVGTMCVTLTSNSNFCVSTCNVDGNIAVRTPKYPVTPSNTPVIMSSENDDVSILPPKEHFENFIEDLYEYCINDEFEDAVQLVSMYEHDLKHLFSLAFCNNRWSLKESEMSMEDVLDSLRQLSNNKFQFYYDNRTNVKRLCGFIDKAIKKMQEINPNY